MTEVSTMFSRNDQQSDDAEPRFEHAAPTETERIEGWRMHLLVEAGMSFTDARILSSMDDWRKALDLLEHGCPASIAFEIAR